MPMHLGALANHTVLNPIPNVLVEAMPDELPGHQLLQQPLPRVGKAVHGIENLHSQLPGMTGLGCPMEK